MILIKKQIQQKQQPLKFLNATKTAHFLVPRTLEIAFPSCQISSFSGVHVPRPLGERDLMAALVITDTSYTFSGRLQLMFIETPVTIN